MSARKYWVILFAFAARLLLAPSWAAEEQSQSHSQGDMSGMDMSRMSMVSPMQHDASSNPDTSRSAHDAMPHEHMEMNPHMYMTALRPENEDDEKRGEKILHTLRSSIDRYKDYRVAIGDGYQIYLPNLPQPQYHFTNWRYAFEAEFAFNPAHPTSLLYKKTRTGYELSGAMYTAPKRFTEDQLNDRVPLSVARWHKHINLCQPPKGAPVWQVNWRKYGLGGSIATEDACNEAGGRWIPQIFGWMVHVYPFESDPEKIWAH